jgi:hypothetical protein
VRNRLPGWRSISGSEGFFIRGLEIVRAGMVNFYLCTDWRENGLAGSLAGAEHARIEHERIEGDSTGERPAGEERLAKHSEQFCPNCSAQLKQGRCKLSCPATGPVATDRTNRLRLQCSST